MVVFQRVGDGPAVVHRALAVADHRRQRLPGECQLVLLGELYELEVVVQALVGKRHPGAPAIGAEALRVPAAEVEEGDRHDVPPAGNAAAILVAPPASARQRSQDSRPRSRSASWISASKLGRASWRESVGQYV